MTQNNQPSNFWFGFLLGAGVTAGGLYFFATKKGRTQLRTALELTEDLENTVDDVYHAVVDTYHSADQQPPRVIHAEPIGEDTSTMSTLRKAYGLLRLFGSKYHARHGMVPRNQSATSEQ